MSSMQSVRPHKRVREHRKQESVAYHELAYPMAAGAYDRDDADLANLQFKLLLLHQAQEWHAVIGDLAILCNFTMLALIV